MPNVVGTFALMDAAWPGWHGNRFVGKALLASLIGFDQGLGAGLKPFLFGDLVKAVTATAIMPLAWQWVGDERAH